MKCTTAFTTSLYALFIVSWAVVAGMPSSCPAPWADATVKFPSLLDIIPFGLISLLGVHLLRRRHYVVTPGWCSQTLVWPLLLMGLAGVALAAGCGQLESAHPTLDPFVNAMHGSIWALRSKLALLGGLTGVLLFHLCVRREPAETGVAAS